MRTILLAITVVAVGCSQEPPTAPAAPIQEVTIRTSRVNPNDLEDSFLENLTLDHNPWDPNVSLCRTKLREYCTPDGSRCDWEIDYYTVMRPEVCPLEPIE